MVTKLVYIDYIDSNKEHGRPVKYDMNYERGSARKQRRVKRVHEFVSSQLEEVKGARILQELA